MNAKILEEAIANISSTSQALDQYCNDPKNSNSYTAYLLAQMSDRLHKHADELREIDYMYGA